MATLLRIDSSPLGDGASFSRQLTSEFVEKWKRSHPDGRVITRDVAATQLSPIDAEWIGAAYAPKENRTPRQRSSNTGWTPRRNVRADVPPVIGTCRRPDEIHLLERAERVAGIGLHERAFRRRVSGCRHLPVQAERHQGGGTGVQGGTTGTPF